MNFLKIMIKWRKYWNQGEAYGKQIGKVFRQLRESRNISLRQATGGQFSPSMLSRFETGQSELSVEKFLFALEKYICQCRGNPLSSERFSVWYRFWVEKRNHRCLGSKNIAPLEDLYRKEYQKHAHSQNKQKHILNAIMIKSYMKSMDETVELTAEEGKVLHDYLFSTEIWGNLWTQFYFQSVHHFYLFLFSLGMLEKWYVNLIF